MKRRTFLGILGGTAAAFILDPEYALWVPGQRTFFLPPDRELVTATESDIEALMAAVGGPFMVTLQRVYNHLNSAAMDLRVPAFGMPSTPEAIIKCVSNEEYRLLVARGHRILASQREIVRQVFGADGQLMPAERAKVLRAQGWTLSDDLSPHIVGRG